MGRQEKQESMIREFAKVLKKSLNLSAAIIVFLLLWELAARLGIIVNPLFLPPFSKVLTALAEVAVSGELWRHALISLRRAISGYCFGLLFSIPFGLLIGWYKRIEAFLWPLLQVFRNLPILALFPVFIMFFGIGEVSKTAIIFWAAIWVVLLNTISGVRSVDSQLIKASRSMGTSPLRLFATVILPGALPFIFTGMRLAASNSILVLVAAEMMGASRGLGYALNFNQSNMFVDRMYAYLMVMAIIGCTLNFSLEAVERRIFKWRAEVNTT
jgi:NitT/TauT family transport system permease protein